LKLINRDELLYL